MSPGALHLTPGQQARARGDCGHCRCRWSGKKYRCMVCEDARKPKPPARSAAYRESDRVRRAARRDMALARGMCFTCCIRLRRHLSNYCIECGNSARRGASFFACCAAVGAHRASCLYKQRKRAA